MAMCANHVFGSQRQLFDWPAIAIEAAQVRAAQLEWTGQQPRLLKARVVDGNHHEGGILWKRLEIGKHQVIPELSPEGETLILPGFDTIWWVRFNPLTIVRIIELAHSHSFIVVQIRGRFVRSS